MSCDITKMPVRGKFVFRYFPPDLNAAKFKVGSWKNKMADGTRSLEVVNEDGKSCFVFNV